MELASCHRDFWHPELKMTPQFQHKSVHPRTNQFHAAASFLKS